MTNCDKSINLDLFKKDILIQLLWHSLYKDDDKWPQPLLNKLKEIIKHWDAMMYVKKEFTELNLKPSKLTHDEQKTLRLGLEKQIINTFPDMLNEFDKLTNGQIKKSNKYSDGELTCEQKKIINLCNKYYENLQEMQRNNVEICTLMKEWTDIRLGVMVKKIENKAEIIKYKCKLTEIEGKILNVQLKRFVYGGKISSVKDYIEYYNSMKEKLGEYNKEILNQKRILNMGDEFSD